MISNPGPAPLCDDRISQTLMARALEGDTRAIVTLKSNDVPHYARAIISEAGL